MFVNIVQIPERIFLSSNFSLNMVFFLFCCMCYVCLADRSSIQPNEKQKKKQAKTKLETKTSKEKKIVCLFSPRNDAQIQTNGLFFSF